VARGIFRVTLLVGVGLHAPAGHAQSTTRRAAFEVAAIKLNRNCGNEGLPGGASPGRVNVRCATLRGLIRTAYSVFGSGTANMNRADEVLGGPRWVYTDHYEISAMAEGDPPRAQMMGPMLRTLLEARFKLKVHTESRDSAVYALTVVNSNPRLQASKEDSCIPMDLASLPEEASRASELVPKYCGSGGNRATGLNMVSDWYGVTMAEFADRLLSPFVDRAVVDKTRLSGKYDVHLEFVRGEGPAGLVLRNGEYSPGSPAGTSDVGASVPSIFTAVREQLGLKLVQDRSPLEVVVIDHVERPSGN
jgi:uncharacterized protein (TIGR03435 family)